MQNFSLLKRVADSSARAVKRGMADNRLEENGSRGGVHHG